MPADARPLATSVRYGLLVGVVLFAAVPVYVYLEPQWRAVVPRLAAALLLGVALLELRGTLARRVARHGGSALDAARVSPIVEPGVPHRLVELRASVRAGLRSRRHFETVLWPRLTELAARPLALPRLRRGRGPSVAGFRAVIAAIEEQR